MSRLGGLEQAVMDVLWRHDRPLTVREAADALARDDLAYTTVMTVLDRLTKKGFLRRERVGRAWAYWPAASREMYITQLMLDALELTGDRDAALQHFARSVSAPEAAALRDALSAAERARRGRRPE